jgi:hypothetical protein
MGVNKVLQRMSMMSTMSWSHRSLRYLPVLALMLACACLAAAPSAIGDVSIAGTAQPAQAAAASSAPIASATLQQCLTAASQDERSAMFSGEMTAIPGSVHMAMRIDVQEQLSGEAMFRSVTAPGLDVWRTADAGVRTYRYVNQVTNLSAPAFYRAVVRFRWLNARGRLIRLVERQTPRCVQPAPTPTVSSPAAASGSAVGASGSAVGASGSALG